MAWIKCPRCELNYMQDTERYCTVCKREMRGEEEHEELELCSECGEHPALPGEELCAFCLKELRRHEHVDATEEEGEETPAAEEVVELDAASGMNEIDIVNDQDIPSNEMRVINRELDTITGTTEEEPGEPESYEQLREDEDRDDDEDSEEQ